MASISFASLHTARRHSPRKEFDLPEVRDFDCIVVAEEVLGLQVPMKVILLVHVGQTLQGLVHDVADEVLREEFLALLHQLVHVHVQKFKNEVQGVPLKHHLVQLHDVGVRELDQ